MVAVTNKKQINVTWLNDALIYITCSILARILFASGKLHKTAKRVQCSWQMAQCSVVVFYFQLNNSAYYINVEQRVQAE